MRFCLQINENAPVRLSVRPTVRQNNFCSDVQSWNYGGWAYYTDEGSRDELFQNNVATRTKCAGHHQHYGTDNHLLNNIYYVVNTGDVKTPGRSVKQ